MTELILLFVFLLTLTYLLEVRSHIIITLHKDGQSFQSKQVAFILSLISIALFVGLREGYNDTYGYLYLFDLIDTSNYNEINFDKNLGFNFFSFLFKKYISTEGHLLLFSMAFLSYIFLFRLVFFRINIRPVLFIFFLFTTGYVLFSMGAVKQFAAMSIGFYAIQSLKESKLKFLVFLSVAILFHVFAVVYLSVLFLNKKIWDYKVLLFGIVCAGVLFFNDTYFSSIENITNSLGLKYSQNNEILGEGMNIFRFLFLAITPVLIYFNLESLKKIKDPALITYINFSAIGFFIFFISMFFNANTFGRLGIYFGFVNILILPFIIQNYFQKSYMNKNIIYLIHVIFMGYELYTRGFDYSFYFL